MPPCPFCEIAGGTASAWMVASTPVAVAFLDRSPVFKGHVLVVPREHVTTLPALPADLLPGYFELVQRVSDAIPDALGAHGTFVAINNTVSQSVAHLHTHVVPRRRKDGLRGFFWPRLRYDSDSEAMEFASALRSALAQR